MKSSGARWLSLFLCTFCLGCGDGLNVKNPINKGGIPLGPQQPKPTAFCTTALQTVQNFLKANPTIDSDLKGKSLRTLPDGTCAIVLLVNDVDTVLQDAQYIEANTKFISFIAGSPSAGVTKLVPFWYDQPFKQYPPVSDAAGKLIDATVTKADCDAVAAALGAAQKANGGHTLNIDNHTAAVGGACFVQLYFDNEIGFKKYLSSNPADRRIFYQVNVRADTSGAVVPVYAFYRSPDLKP